MAWKELTSEQWSAIEALLPSREHNPKGGRPRADARKCFEGILWILWTGAPWSELPERYGKPSTVHRRLTQWAQDDTLLDLWRAFLNQLDEEGMISWNECFVDGTFILAKKRGAGVGKTKRGKGTKLMAGALWAEQMARVLRSEFTWTRRPRRK